MKGFLKKADYSFIFVIDLFKKWPDHKHFKLSLFIIFAIGFLANFFTTDRSAIFEITCYQIILLIIFYISVKAWRFLVAKHKLIREVVDETEFLSNPELLDEDYEKVFRSKPVLFAFLSLSLSIALYVLLLNNVAFSSPMSLMWVYALFVLWITLFCALFAGRSFISLILLVKTTVHIKTKKFNHMFPIATPVFNRFRTALSFGIMYFWTVCILMIFLAISHIYVLNIKDPNGSTITSIINRYSTVSEQIINTFKYGVSNGQNNGNLFVVWLILGLVVVGGFIWFSFYPYYLLRDKILSLKMDAINEIKSESTKHMETITFIYESPNWHKGTFFVSTVPLTLSLLVTIIQIIGSISNNG